MLMQTSHADEAGFKIRHHVIRTRLLLMQVAVRYSQHARLSAGASFVHLQQDVGGASDVDVGVGTSAVFHATVASGSHHDDGTKATRGVERLPLTVLHQHFYKQ